MAPSREPTVRFHNFELCLHTGELRKFGRKLKITGQPVQILSMLLERPGQMVTREEIHDRLWPGTLVDVDHSLNTAINKIRDVLGDSAESPRYVETIPRRGYRFIAPVISENHSSGDEAAAIALEHTRTGQTTFAGEPTSVGRHIQSIGGKPGPHPVRYIATIAVVIVVASVTGWMFWARSDRNKFNAERRVVSNAPENPIRSAVISPDGKFLAYQDKTGIFVKAPKTGETHAVPWPESVPAHVDGWFPDSSNLLITRQDVPHPSLCRVSVFGGPPVKLIEDASGGSVSPDGSQIAFHRYRQPGDTESQSLWVSRLDGSGETQIAPEGKDTSSPWGIAWSPDSRKVAVVRLSWSYVTDTGTIELVDLASRSQQTMFTQNGMGTGLVWSRDDRILFAKQEPPPNRGDSNVWALTIENSRAGTPFQVTTGSGWTDAFSAPVDGKSLFCLKNYAQQQMFIATLSADGTQVTSHKRLAADDSLNVATAWTADSQYLLMESDRNGKEDLYKQPLNGSLPEPLVATSQDVSQPRLSPDGREVLYLSTPAEPSPEASTTIMAVPVEGGPPRKILRDIGIWNLQCSRAPSTLCMYANQHGSQMTVFRFDVSNGRATEAFTRRIRNWSLSPSGDLIAFSGTDAQQNVLQIRSTTSGEERDMKIEGHGGIANVDWAADGKTILISTADSESDRSLLKVRFDGSVTVLLHHKYSVIIGTIPSPDGRSLAIAEFHLGPTIVWARDLF